MKMSKYISRIRKLANTIPNNERLRYHSHVVLMSPKDYDYVFNTALGNGTDAKNKFLTIAKMIAIKMPFIAKRKFQVMKWCDYLKMWNRYEEKYRKMSKESKEANAKELAQMTKPVEAINEG